LKLLNKALDNKGFNKSSEVDFFDYLQVVLDKKIDLTSIAPDLLQISLQ